MIGGVGARIHRYILDAPGDVLSEKNEVAGERLRPLRAVVHAQGVIVRPAAVAHLPGVAIRGRAIGKGRDLKRRDLPRSSTKH